MSATGGGATGAWGGGAASAAGGGTITFESVSKFYGEVLGVNRIQLTIEPGITSLVGPNGSGKTTLMNLMMGLLRPNSGTIRILGIPPDRPEDLFRLAGYCTQFDTFPRGLTGRQFIYGFLRIHGKSHADADALTTRALERVKLTEAAGRRIAGYSKGMRQRIKLAQAIAHEPSVLLLDEPLNGLDPMARAEVIGLFQELAHEGRFVIVSSHILHEVDLVSDRVVFIKNGYVVAEGEVADVRSEMKGHPMQILIRCDKPELLASRVFELDNVVEVKMHDDRQGLLVSTRDADSFYLLLNKVVLDGRLSIETVAPADEDVHAVYRYLIGNDGESA